MQEYWKHVLAYFMICVISWLHTPNLSSCINLVILKHELKSQYVKLTQLWPLTVKYVLSFIWQTCYKTVKNLLLLHICRPNDYTEVFCCNFILTIFLLIFFPLLRNVFSDILKIFELAKIYNKIPKYCQAFLVTITIYQITFFSQLHLAFELYPY